MDLSTTYLGLKLKNPIVPSASPLSYKLSNIKKMEDAGASAVVMYSLFEEQIEQESNQLYETLNFGAESYAEALTYLPDPDSFNVGPDEYVESIRKAKEAVSIPIIGSLNGVSGGGWTRYASLIEEAGADALELNLYYLPTAFEKSAGDLEKTYVDALKSVLSVVKIPVAVKIGPFFSALPNVAKNFEAVGAKGLVAFNRFYQPDFDLENLEVTPNLVLSQSDELRLPLRWIAILYGRVNLDFAISSGVHTHYDVIKSMMAGAKTAQTASELLQKGIGRIGEIVTDLENWMEEKEYESIEQMQGSMSQKNIADPDIFERANYMKVLNSFRYNPLAQAL